MAVVKMPDGTLVNLPDNPTPEEQQQIAAMFKAAAPEEKGWLSKAVDTAKDVATSVSAGFGKAAAMAPKALSYMMPTAEAAKTLSDDSENVQRYWQGVGDKSKLGRYGKAIAEGVGGGLTAPTGGLAQTMIPAATGAAGSEAAAQGLGEGPVTRFLGGLAGGAAGSAAVSSVANRVRPQTAAVAREAVEGISQEQLRKAQEFQAAARKQNVTLDLAQALEAVGVPSSNLTTIRNSLANSRHGTNVQSTLRTQANDLQNAAELGVGKMPGNQYPLGQAANNVQEAATGRIKQETQARTEAVRGDYAKAGMLPVETQKAVISELQLMRERPEMTQAARGVVDELLERFTNAPQTSQSLGEARKAIAAAAKPSQKLAARGQLAEANNAAEATQPLHSLEADVALSDALGAYKGSPTYLANPKATGQTKEVAARVNNLLKEGSPEIAKAEQKFAQISQESVNPLKQGPVGQFATPRGYLPDRAASTAKLSAFFDKGTAPDSKISEIRVLGKELQKADPEAFQDAFKSWMADKLQNGAAAQLTPGQTQPGTFAKAVYNDVFADPRRWQGIKDAVSVIAEQNGLPPAEVVKGLTHIGMMVKGAANRPATVGGLSPMDLTQLGSTSAPANVLRIFGFLPFERAARKFEDATLGTTLRTFDALLTSPDGAATLAALAKVPPTRPAAQALLSGFLSGTRGAAEGEFQLQQRQNPPGITPQ